MIGCLYIDGVDAFREYGVAIVDGGYNGLVSAAELKKVDFTDWPDEDGIEPDLSKPVFDSKEFDIPFGGDFSKTDDLLAFLSTKPYHDFEFEDISASRRLRLVSQPSKETTEPMEAFTLRFADDFPSMSLLKYTDVWGTEDGRVIMTEDEINAIIIEYDYSTIGSKVGAKDSIVPIYQQCYLDGVKLSNYGIVLLDGCYDEVMKIPAVKKNLSSSTRSKQGLTYDNHSVKFQSKDVALRCCMHARSINDFWNQYSSLLSDLTRPNERRLYIGVANDTFSCFYRSYNSTFFSVVGSEVWHEFTLTLTFTDFRPKKSYYVWGTEDDRVIMTEDELNTIIK